MGGEGQTKLRIVREGWFLNVTNENWNGIRLGNMYSWWILR